MPLLLLVGPVIWAVIKAIAESRLLLAILAAIVGLGYLLEALFGWAWANVFVMVRDFVLHLFDPATLVNAAMLVLSLFFRFVGYIAPGVVGTKITAFGAWLSSVEVLRLLRVCLWFINPIVDQAVIRGCLQAVVLIWVATGVLKIGMNFKHELPGGGTAT